jgi:hypothetical protein
VARGPRSIEVQRKIAEQQSALQTYEILQRLAATLEDEIRLAMALNNVVYMMTTIDRFKEQGPPAIPPMS